MGEELRSVPFDWDNDHEEAPGSSGVICAQCEDSIEMTEECFLIQVVQPQKIGGQLFFYPVKDEFSMEGDFLFEPYHFCFSCWEDLLEDLQKEMRDVPPVEDALSILECSCCGSGVREWEYCATYSLGEFRRSSRAPAPECSYGPVFQQDSGPEVLCTYCAALLNEVAITMWEDFSHEGECIDCIQLRCWRYGDVCVCSCHEEGESDE